MQRGSALIILLIGILVITAAGGTFYLGTTFQKSASTPNPVTTSQTQQLISQDRLGSPSLSATWQTPTPVTDETANWKTYKNNTYGYSFALPPNWSLTENSPDDFKGFSDKQANTSQDIADTVMGAVVVNKKPSVYATNKDYFDHFYNQTNLEPGVTAKRLSIDGEQAVMLVEAGESNTILEGKEGIRVVIYHKGDVFEIGRLGEKIT